MPDLDLKTSVCGGQ